MNVEVFDFAPPVQWGDRVRIARHARAWSMRELAERAGYPRVPSTVLRMERWPAVDIWLTNFIAISDALGFEVVWQPKDGSQ